MRPELLFPFLILPLVPHSVAQFLTPNCTSLSSFNFKEFALNEVPTCFCEKDEAELSEGSRPAYRVDCLWGSDAKDMALTLQNIAASGSRLSKIHANSFTSGDIGFPEDFFAQTGVSPQEINIEKCVGRLFFDPEAFTTAETDIFRLNISRCHLGHIPIAFRKLRSLNFLQLRECQITELPSRAFLGMDNLDMLDLTYNGMHIMDPDAFAGIPNLETLVLGPGNRLDESIFSALNDLRSLKAFWMPFGRVKRIPPGSLANLTHLVELMLPRNHLESLNAGSFIGVEDLEELDLRVNLIHALDDAVFAPLKRLKKLYMDANYVGSLTPETFVGLVRLEELGLAFNEMEFIPGGTFEPMFNLEMLDLHHNTRLKSLSPRAFKGLKNLRSLNLSETGLTLLENDVFAPLVNLEVLDLSSAPIEVVGPDTFIHLPKLKNLIMSNTKITSLPAAAFSAMSLQVLDISGNPFKCDEGLIDLIYWIQNGYRIGLQTGKKVRIKRLLHTLCTAPFNMLGKPIAWVDLGKLLVE